MRDRDNQRARVYRAENKARQGTKGLSFETVAEMQKYVDRLHRSKWFQKRWPRIKSFTVTDGRGRRSGASFGTYWSTLKMPRWSRHEEYLLHEVAHTCTASSAREAAAHGPEFVTILLELIGHQMGAAARDHYLKTFIEHGVTRR